MPERLILDLERFLRRARTASPDAAPGLDLVYAWIDGVRAGESAERNARPRERAVFDAAAFAALTTPDPERPTTADDPVADEAF